MNVCDDMTMRQVLRNYQVQVGQLESEKHDAVKRLKVQWNQLQTLWNELGAPREDSAETFDPRGEFSDIDETKLGPKTFHRYGEQIGHWTAERERRAKIADDLMRLISQLESQLGEGEVSITDLCSGQVEHTTCGRNRLQPAELSLDDRIEVTSEQGRRVSTPVPDEVVTLQQEALPEDVEQVDAVGGFGPYLV